jgi:hypothetical protein
LGLHCLQLLDGTRTRADLLTDLTAFAVLQGLPAESGEILTDVTQIRYLLNQRLDDRLQQLIRSGLLIA